MSARAEFFDTVPVNEQWLRDNYLFGLRLEDERQNPFPSSMFENAVKQAIAYIQRYIDVCILPTKFREEHDYDIDNYKMWSYLAPDHIPILSVERVAAEFPFGETAVEFPEEWIVIDPLRHIQIVPRSGSLATVFLGAGQILLPLLHGATGYVPNLLVVEYTAGFKVDEIPWDILHAISLLASIQILHPAGDLIIGAGISNQEIAVNGLRQKLETTSSPTNAGFGARILNYKNELKEHLKLLRETYQGIRMAIA